MTMPSAAAAAASTGLSLLIGWTLLFWFYRRYRIDLFRERMFALRDELFVMALDGDIRFSHPAYTLTRTTLNGFIRFGHRINAPTLAVSAWAVRTEIRRDSEDRFAARFEAATSELAPETKAHLEYIVERMNIFTVDQLVFTSPLLMALLVPALLILIAKKLGAEAMRRLILGQWVKERLDPVDSVAFRFGSVGQDLAAAA